MSPQLKLPLAPALLVSCALGLAAARFATRLSSQLKAAHAYARAGGKGHTPAPSEYDDSPSSGDLAELADDRADDDDDDDEVTPALVSPGGALGRSVGGAEMLPLAHSHSRSDDDATSGRTGAREAKAARSSRKGAKARERASEIDGVEALFGPLLVLSAVSVAFVHGAQDVSNSAGPLMQLTVVLSGGTAGSGAQSAQWPLLLGVCSFVLGDLTLGWRVIGTVGSEITDMTPSRAFAAQMGTVVALTSATLVSLPVSSSECIVGSVIGVGLAKRYLGYADAGIELSVLKRIWAAWVLTIPYAGSIAACLFLLLNSICPFRAGK